GLNTSTQSLDVTITNVSGNTVHGTRLADHIVTTRYVTGEEDRIFGRGGNDILAGRAGNDVLSGGVGNDRLYGGPGSDQLIGGPGKDRLTGGAGHDSYVFNSAIHNGNVDRI